MNFKAAVLFKQKTKLKIVKLKIPEKLEKGQILVKIINAAICGAQIGEIDGVKGKDRWLPHCMGHEGFGKVVKVPHHHTKFKVNDHVILHWRQSYGHNARPASYNSKYGIINAGNVTTFQEYAIISENRLTKINYSKKFLKIYPLLGCAIPTSWGILNKEIKLNKKDNLLIFGAGGIGITIGIIAKIMGIKCIDLIDNKNKKNLLKKFGLNFVKSKNLKKLSIKNYSKVIDTTGDVKNIEKGFDLTSKNGFLVLVGQPKINSNLLIKNPLRLFNSPNDNIKIISSDGGMFNPDQDLKKIFKMIKDNLPVFKKIISHSFNLNNINKAIRILRKGKSIRVGIKL